MASSATVASLSATNGKQVKPGRLPQAPASLLVQLPPDELKKFQYASTNRISSSNNDGDIDKAGAGIVEASDLHSLATSIQHRREREARVFEWQQRLIDADERLSRSDLKRALTQLSLSSWLQVLQERHLDNRCTYPTCSRKPMKAHLSLRETVLPLDAPRYRISLSKRTIKRDERDDAGGENGYCSKACWRRGEWISRWVLEGNMNNRKEKEMQAARSDQEVGSVIDGNKEGLGSHVDEGGRWERLVDEDNWEKIELLEDLEDDGQVDRLSDDESISRMRFPQPSSRTVNGKDSPYVSSADLQIVSSTDSTSQDNTLKSTSENLTTSDIKEFSKMLESLEIVERPPGQTTISNPIEVAQDHYSKPSQEPHLRSLRSTEQNRVNVKSNYEEAAHLSDADSDDLDVIGELSLGNGREDGIDVISTILQSSRNLQRVDTEQESDSPDAAMTEEELKRYKEEDDLFAQAWQARDEEKAKGNWEE